VAQLCVEEKDPVSTGASCVCTSGFNLMLVGHLIAYSTIIIDRYSTYPVHRRRLWGVVPGARPQLLSWVGKGILLPTPKSRWNFLKIFKLLQKQRQRT